MKTILVPLMVIALLAITGVYAASISGTAKTVGGTGNITVSSPTSSAVVITWQLSSGLKVSGMRVNWSPDVSSDYTLVATLDGSEGSLSITNSGTTNRVDIVPISPPVDAKTASVASLSIAED